MEHFIIRGTKTKVGLSLRRVFVGGFTQWVFGSVPRCLNLGCDVIVVKVSGRV